MNIKTKYGVGDVVYTIHSYKTMFNGQVILDEKAYNGFQGIETENEQELIDTIYVVNACIVQKVILSSNEDNGIVINYQLSDGTICHEENVFATFESAMVYANILYSKNSEKADTHKFNMQMCSLKDIVCMKLQESLKAVLSTEQLERFTEEFLKATDGVEFREVMLDGI